MDEATIEVYRDMMVKERTARCSVYRVTRTGNARGAEDDAGRSGASGTSVALHRALLIPDPRGLMRYRGLFS